MKLSKLQIAKEGRNAGKHINSFRQIIIKVVDDMVAAEDKKERERIREGTIAWLNRNFPKK